MSGSDQGDGPILGVLADQGVSVSVGHRPSAVGGAEFVVASSAIPSTNVEVVAARELGVPVLSRREFLPAMAMTQPLLSVSGTHGKTTTSSMLAVALRGAGSRVSWLIGADVPTLGSPAHHDDGPWMVLEADESDGSFLAAPRAGAIVTNLEADHLEYWGDWAALKQGFERFVAGTDGPVVVCADDPEAAALVAIAHPGGRTVTYGRDPGPGSGRADGPDYAIADLQSDATGSAFDLVTPTGRHQVRLALPGVHNALNATAALALCAELGVDVPAAIAGLGEHTGVHRRFERRGRIAGADVVDDYAHLPTEVAAALQAGRAAASGRLVVVFQPHRYPRTQALWASFAECFDAADVLVLTDIYPAGEAPREGVSGRLILDAVAQRGVLEPIWAATLVEAAEVLRGVLREGDLLMTVGAGDVREVGDRVLGDRALGDRALGDRVSGDPEFPNPDASGGNRSDPPTPPRGGGS